MCELVFNWEERFVPISSPAYASWWSDWPSDNNPFMLPFPSTVLSVLCIMTKVPDYCWIGASVCPLTGHISCCHSTKSEWFPPKQVRVCFKISIWEFHIYKVFREKINPGHTFLIISTKLLDLLGLLPKLCCVCAYSLVRDVSELTLHQEQTPCSRFMAFHF